MTGKRIYLSPPDIGNLEKKLVREAFDSNWIAPLGPHVDAFENELAEYTQCGHAAVLSSGTAALHLALILLGVQRGDAVISQSFTFCGSVNPVVYAGAYPVLIDSESHTWNLDPELLEKAIKELISKNRKPKSIIFVHLYGMPAKIHEIQEIAAAYGIPLIEDAAEALGSRFDGRPVGRSGYFGILSFNGNKIITTGGGGALLSGDPEKIKKARFLASQARDPAPHYQHSELGYNYRLSNVSAAIGRGQLKGIDEKVTRRRRIHDFYRKTLSNIENIRFYDEQEMAYSNRWLTCITLENTGPETPEKLRSFLEMENIESRPLWKPMHLQPLYKDAIFYGNGISEDLFRRGLCLPSGSGMSDEDLERVVKRIRKFFEGKIWK